MDPNACPFSMIRAVGASLSSAARTRCTDSRAFISRAGSDDAMSRHGMVQVQTTSDSAGSVQRTLLSAELKHAMDVPHAVLQRCWLLFEDLPSPMLR